MATRFRPCAALIIASGGLASALTTPAHGGAVACGPFTTDMAAAYLASGDPALRAAQDTDSAWTYHQGTPSGPLLVGIPAANLNVAAGFWGSSTLAFNIPTGGPIYSDNPLINQIPFSYRPPSFTGVFLHPGEGDGLEGCASLNIQAPVFVTAVTGKFEKLGTWDGALCRVVKRVGGVDTDVVAQTFAAPHPSAAVDLVPISGSLPLALNPGDKLWVQTQRFGNANEDWCNVNVSVTLEGGPLVPAAATVTPACFGRSAKLRVEASAPGSPTSGGATASTSRTSSTAMRERGQANSPSRTSPSPTRWTSTTAPSPARAPGSQWSRAPGA